MTDSAIPVATDDAFTAISNRRRRYVICILTRTTESVAARDLAVDIAAIEQQCRPSQVTSDKQSSVYISLIQTHLDRLKSLEVVNYDERSKQVSATTATRSLAHYIYQLNSTTHQAENPHLQQNRSVDEQPDTEAERNE